MPISPGGFVTFNQAFVDDLIKKIDEKLNERINEDNRILDEQSYIRVTIENPKKYNKSEFEKVKESFVNVGWNNLQTTYSSRDDELYITLYF